MTAWRILVAVGMLGRIIVCIVLAFGVFIVFPPLTWRTAGWLLEIGLVATLQFLHSREIRKKLPQQSRSAFRFSCSRWLWMVDILGYMILLLTLNLMDAYWSLYKQTVRCIIVGHDDGITVTYPVYTGRLADKDKHFHRVRERFFYPAHAVDQKVRRELWHPWEDP